MLEWLAYVPSVSGGSLPVTATADPADRDIAYECDKQNDPRLMLTGRYLSPPPQAPASPELTPSAPAMVPAAIATGASATASTSLPGASSTGAASSNGTGAGAGAGTGAGSGGASATEPVPGTMPLRGNPSVAWLSGFFDRDSFREYLGGWARTVIIGRARLGGIPVGVITPESQPVVTRTPADPASPESHEITVTQAGGVWYPDSAFKTAQVSRCLAVALGRL